MSWLYCVLTIIYHICSSQVAKAEDYVEATKEAGLIISIQVFLSSD